MNIFEHLFVAGEYGERNRLLSGLTLEQVTCRPDGLAHSIYDELWHLVGYQQSILEPTGEPPGELYPTWIPQREEEWYELVDLFHTGAQAAANLGLDPERLASKFESGLTLAEELHCVAVHNAYHFGKIVALRMQMGAWPPTDTTVS